MYILKNAIENVARNKGRNILMGVIILAIIATTVVALIINNTANTVIASYKDRFSSEVFISPDMARVQEEAQRNATGGMVRIMRPDPVETELLLQFADSAYLKESIAYNYISVNSYDNEITALDQEDETEDESQNEQESSGYYSRSNPGGGLAVTSMRAPGMNGNYRLYGDFWQDFSDGYRSLESGEMPMNDSECIISSDLAELNNISIGDIFTFTAELSVSYDTESEEYSEIEVGDTIIFDGVEYTVAEGFMGGRATREVNYQLKVVGIYLDLTDDYANEMMPKLAAINRRNEILTTFNTVIAERNPGESGIEVDVKYYLENPDMLSAFEAEVRSKGLPDMYLVSTDTASYERIVKPVEGLRGISIAFMLIVLILGGVILALLSTMAIRERKYEIGVLRAMGMKKSKVALGLWTEMIALTCVCLIIGLSVGAIIAQPVTDSLLDMQAESEEQSNNMPGGMMITSGMRIGGGAMNLTVSNATPLSEMQINIGIDTIIEIIIIALLLASVAALASISKITKYEPIKILMERN